MTASNSAVAIDQRLVAVGDQVELMGSALVDLEDDPARVLLPTAPLTGATAIAWAETEARIQVLWQLYPVMRAAVDELTVQRGTRAEPGLRARERIAAALSGQNVLIDDGVARAALEVTGGAVDLPGRCTLDQLTSAFDAVLQLVRSVLRDVGQVWDRVLPALVECGRELDVVESAARSGGTRVPNELAATRRMIDDLRGRAAADPLDLDLGRLDEVRSSTARVCGSVAEAAELESAYPEKIQRVSERLDAISVHLDRIDRTRRDAAEKILGAGHLAAPLAETAQLGSLQAELDGLGPETPTDVVAADRVLDRLLLACDRLDARLGPLEHEAGAGMAEREELRGRLEAYRVKAATLGRAEDLDLDELQRAAADQLYRAPCDLAAAARLVGAYQQAVNQPSHPEDRR